MSDHSESMGNPARARRRKARPRDVLDTAKRGLFIVVGVLLILLSGPVGVATPLIPVGAVLLFTGMALIARNSRAANICIYMFLKRNPWLSTRIPDRLSRLFLGSSRT